MKIPNIHNDLKKKKDYFNYNVNFNMFLYIESRNGNGNCTIYYEIQNIVKKCEMSLGIEQRFVF